MLEFLKEIKSFEMYTYAQDIEKSMLLKNNAAPMRTFFEITFKILYPILFNDMIHNIMINFVMPEHVDEAVKASEISKSLGCRIRIVTSQESLREKTAIINSGLDDRVVELFKVFAMGQIADQIEGRNLKAMYFLPDEKQPRMEFAFEDGTGFIDIVMDGYYHLEEEFSEALADTEDDMFIDQQWALDLLNSLKQEEENEA